MKAIGYTLIRYMHERIDEYTRLMEKAIANKNYIAAGVWQEKEETYEDLVEVIQHDHIFVIEGSEDDGYVYLDDENWIKYLLEGTEVEVSDDPTFSETMYHGRLIGYNSNQTERPYGVIRIADGQEDWFKYARAKIYEE